MHKILDLVMTFIVVLSCTSVVYGMDDDDAKKASSLRLLHKSLSSSDSGDENEKAPQKNINEKEPEKDLAPFLTVWVDKKIIFISGLKIVNNEESLKNKNEEFLNNLLQFTFIPLDHFNYVHFHLIKNEILHHL